MYNLRSEVLSPVGNTDMLYAAVRSGADAVYLGAKDFSARRNAENFSIEELKNAIEYCHVRGVRVYLTLNILIKQNEFAAAFALAQDAYNAGIDGIIIEDLGLARVLHEKIPKLALHASTQMSVHSPSALPILKELGFCRVVAAREMSEDALRTFCKKAKDLGITVEVFVHGALCMSMSGQCLLSSFLGARSGNRGLCAGPCRLPFSVKNGTGYDLSLKDLSLLEHIGALCEMGVGSFKIEGRMKRPEYVAAATAAVRQAVDHGKTEPQLAKTLQDVFSRQGFTYGYYKNKLGKDMFGIRTKENVTAADSAFPLLHELYRKERQSVRVGVTLKIEENKPILLTLTDSQNTVCATGCVPQKALNKPISAVEALESVSKFGSTPYIAEGGTANVQDGLFVPKSELNELRRKACELLDRARARVVRNSNNYEYKPTKYSGKNTPSKCKTLARFERAEQIPDNLCGIDGIIFPLEQDITAIKDISLPIIADIPRGIDDEILIEKRLQIFKENGVKSALCGNLSAVRLAQNAGFEIVADTFLNLANSESLETARQLGIDSAIVSVEERIADISALSSPIEKGVIAYGQLPLMLFKNCPLKNGIACKECDKKGDIVDRMGISFPVRCRMGYSELLNSVPLWLADRKNDLQGFDFTILYFTRESKEDAAAVIKAYKNGDAPYSKHTRGLYYKGSL